MATPSIPSQLQDTWERLRTARLWHDPLSVGLIVVALILNGISLVDMIIRLHPLDYKVPVHYSNLSSQSLGGFDQLGSWYQPYFIVMFGLIVTALNALLAIRAFSRSRVASFLLLLGSVVVGVFALIIANAFSSVS